MNYKRTLVGLLGVAGVVYGSSNCSSIEQSVVIERIADENQEAKKVITSVELMRIDPKIDDWILRLNYEKDSFVDQARGPLAALEAKVSNYLDKRAAKNKIEFTDEVKVAKIIYERK
ncbi:MAG TPA: hypothetical protein VJB94_03250 [Candidatus Nanoarchaeia archaeon]|nr:hypothetical protein [Candidatus Nanoarchaeia archaeon]